jgi:hypothetical protein
METIVNQIERVIGEANGTVQEALLYGTACVILILACFTLLYMVKRLCRI